MTNNTNSGKNPFGKFKQFVAQIPVTKEDIQKTSGLILAASSPAPAGTPG
jgi:hypothetical protein